MGEEPFFKLGVFKVNTAVVVDFIDFTFGGLNAVVVAVVPLPPAFAAGSATPESVVGPGFQDFCNNVFAVVQFERHRGFNIATCGNFNLAAEKAFRHNIMLI